MSNRTPPFVLTRLAEAASNGGGGNQGLAYFGNEHRPFICYGFSAVTNNPGEDIGLSRSLGGVLLTASPTSGFVTLVEWGTMNKRFERLPFQVADPRGNGRAPFPAFPVFTCAPFLIDVAASYIEVPSFVLKVNVNVVELALVPADAANLAAAGLKVPALAASPSNRINR
jgi:hypothetical protein